MGATLGHYLLALSQTKTRSQQRGRQSQLIFVAQRANVAVDPADNLLTYASPDLFPFPNLFPSRRRIHRSLRTTACRHCQHLTRATPGQDRRPDRLSRAATGYSAAHTVETSTAAPN